VYAVAWSDDLALWSRAVQADRFNARAFNMAGQALLNQQHVEEAIEYLDRAIELSPGLYPAWQNRARAWAALGEYERAAADIDRGLAIESLDGVDRIKMRLTQAKIMEKLGKLDEAVYDYSSVIDHPQADAIWRAMALQSRAGLRILQGRTAAAQADLVAVLKIQNYDPQQRAVCEQVLDELKKIHLPKYRGGN
jgi:tetratricopeptide (TPR) repeat protein